MILQTAQRESTEMKNKHSLRLLQQVERTICTHNLLQTTEKVLVALSGGADSVAMLLVLRRLGYRVEALHCNFHLREEESNRDEHFVRQLCEKEGIKLFVRHFDTLAFSRKQKISIEMAARDLRYAWFEEMRRERNASCISVAHHQQDQAETLLLNLLRGSGIRGLAGIHYRNGHIIRPLLDINKEQITHFLKECQQDWMEDSTNQERDALRNRIRLDVLPLLNHLNPKAIVHLAQTAQHVQQALPFYERGLSSEGWNGKNSSPAPETLHTVSFPIEASILHEQIRGCRFTRTQEQDIMQARTGSLITSPTHRLIRDRNRFVLQALSHTSPLPHITTEVCHKSDVKEMRAGVAYFDNQLVQHPLSIRLIQKGDRMIPFGMKGSRLVSDILTDKKLNLFQKERQQVVVDASGRILCIPGLRSSNLCRVTDDTHEVLIIKQE